VDGSGNVYVADQWNYRVQVFTGTGTLLTKWGTPGDGDGQFGEPVGIAVDVSGNVYVVEDYNHRIQKFTSTGMFLMKWDAFGSGNGEFIYPFGVGVDECGSVYATDQGNSRVQKYTSTGTYLTQWGTSGSGNGQFNRPVGVAVDGSGSVYVADQYNHRIQKFDRGVIGVEPSAVRTQLWLAPAMPNPWAGRTTLRFTLAREDRASLGVYDVLGRRLKQWSWPTLPSGAHQVSWDGRTDDGRLTGPGMLFCRLETDGQVLKQKMVRLQ
jgi:secreted PhoX family phosphatase